MRANWSVLFVGIVAILLVTVVVGSIVEIFDDRSSNTSVVIGSYQTYLGAVIALLAAMITAIGVFVAAHLPIRAENIRIAEKRRISAKIGAAILAAEIAGMISSLEAQLEMISGQQAQGFREIQTTKILLSAHLSDIAILETQNFEFCSEITVFVCAVARVNAYGEGYIIGDTQTFEGRIGDAILAGNSIKERLSEFAEKALV
tara:strand:- start:248 stop:856 length:609 start_codon:yes stop_codon:yes gene_type:complete